MPRTARGKSETGIYHIMLRGINRQNLFEDNEDKQRLIETLALYKEKCGYKIYAYCLMNNHMHILIKEEGEPLSLAIKRISSSYVYYFNRKYCRCGHLFQERFKSEAVDTQTYFLTVLRYIHQNPVKANITKRIDEYPWSSYNDYMHGSRLIDIEFGLDIFSDDKAIARKSFIGFSTQENQDKCLEYDDIKRIDDDMARELIKKAVNIDKMSNIQGLAKTERDSIIIKIKNIDNLSIRQISRITGLNYSLIQKICQ
ncbi:MAG: transposase [Ruminiclostridium sp.]|nr:transposase [Ruminiclostridium sp.]